MVHEIEWNYELIRKRTLNITVFDVRQVEIRYCGGSACVGSVVRNLLKGSRGAWGSCACAVPVDKPDSSAWLSVWSVSVCRTSKRPEFNIATALGDPLCPCGAPLTNERRMPVELCIGGNKRSRKSILLLGTAPEVKNVRNSTL